MHGGASPKDSPVGTWSGVKCHLQEWAPLQNWGRMGMLEAAELALSKTEDSLGELSDCKVAGRVGWLFLMALERVANGRDALQYKVSKLEGKL